VYGLVDDAGKDIVYNWSIEELYNSAESEGVDSNRVDACFCNECCSLGSSVGVMNFKDRGFPVFWCSNCGNRWSNVVFSFVRRGIH